MSIPDTSYSRSKPKVFNSTNDSTIKLRRGLSPYVELQVTSSYSFLRGGNIPEELVSEAARLGKTGLAITDYNTCAGIVRAYRVAKELPLQSIVGERLDILFTDNNCIELEEVTEQYSTTPVCNTPNIPAT
ncbi:MAG: PHP domain-containing protein [Bdellovibrionales bacterium]|nr:PHP domain-containing protein [Bdellovibrionales bacterium]